MEQILDPSNVEFIECRACESPCYTFEIDQGRGVIVQALCTVCGNDDPTDFFVPDEPEE